MEPRIHPTDPERDWSSYNSAQTGRRPRALLDAALGVTGGGHERVAVELGCGRGIEARALAEAGWVVYTFDRDPSVKDALEEIGRTFPVFHAQADIGRIRSFPSCDLLFSSAALPYVLPESFDEVWNAAVASIAPNGVLAVDLFGDRDEWSYGPGTYVTRARVEELTSPLDIIQLTEEEYDGPAFSGPKHWHLFTVIARRPPA